MGAAAVQPLSGLPSERWVPAGGGPPGTGMGLAGAPSSHRLSWVPWEAPAGKECQQSAGVVSWHRTQAGAARCQRLVKTLARPRSPCREFPLSGLACGLRRVRGGSGKRPILGRPRPGPRAHTSSPPPLSSSSWTEMAKGETRCGVSQRKVGNQSPGLVSSGQTGAT